MARVGLTAVGRIKHRDLHEAAKRLGGQSALGRALGVSPNVIGAWCNLQGYPQYSEEIEQKLWAVVGKSYDELFPEGLRSATDFLRAPKTFEQHADVEGRALIAYAERTAERMERQLSCEINDGETESERLQRAIKSLGYREREVLKLRYGLDCESHTREETGRVFKISKERVRQIEFKGMGKLRRAMGAAG